MQSGIWVKKVSWEDLFNEETMVIQLQLAYLSNIFLAVIYSRTSSNGRSLLKTISKIMGFVFIKDNLLMHKIKCIETYIHVKYLKENIINEELCFLI